MVEEVVLVMLIQTIAGFNRMYDLTRMNTHNGRKLQISKCLVKIIIPIAGTPESVQRR